MIFDDDYTPERKEEKNRQKIPCASHQLRPLQTLLISSCGVQLGWMHPFLAHVSLTCFHFPLSFIYILECWFWEVEFEHLYGDLVSWDNF